MSISSVINALVGLTVTCETRKGNWTGILWAVEGEKKGSSGVTLAMAVPAEAAASSDTHAPTPLPSLVIPLEDFICLSAHDVDLSAGAVGAVQAGGSGAGGGFATDTAISGGAPRSDRNLVAWQPDAEDVAAGSLEDAAGGKWDQFRAFQAKTGNNVAFDESQYTTSIARETRARHEAKAERLAAEMERDGRRSKTKNIHLLEERGLAPQADGDMDEEDRYGAVLRTAPTLGSAHSSPKLEKASTSKEKIRARQILMQAQKGHSPKMNEIASDPEGLEALNLDPSGAQVSDEQLEDFLLWKSKKERASESENRSSTIAELKAFSTEFKVKTAPAEPASSKPKLAPLREVKLSADAAEFKPFTPAAAAVPAAAAASAPPPLAYGGPPHAGMPPLMHGGYGMVPVPYSGAMPPPWAHGGMPPQQLAFQPLQYHAQQQQFHQLQHHQLQQQQQQHPGGGEGAKGSPVAKGNN
jgi:hypothetical protein